MGDENKRPWYSKKTDTFELADSTPYGEQTEEAIKVADKGANPKFMGFGSFTAEQRARMMASQGLSDQEIRSVIGKVYNQNVKSIKWDYTGE
jgi:hypothetical protein